jgi:hypothetical protein
MEHSASMSESNRLANALKNAQPVEKHVFSRIQVIEAPAFYEFHGIENSATGKRAGIMYRNDAGMFQAGEDARFTKKPRREFAGSIGKIENF